MYTFNNIKYNNCQIVWSHVNFLTKMEYGVFVFKIKNTAL